MEERGRVASAVRAIAGQVGFAQIADRGRMLFRSLLETLSLCAGTCFAYSLIPAFRVLKFQAPFLCWGNSTPTEPQGSNVINRHSLLQSGTQAP